MKRTLLLTILATAAFAQTVVGPRVLPTFTLASPPTVATGTVLIFSDSATLGSCTSGGSSLATCRWSGSAWQPTGGGGSSTPGGSNGQVQYNNSSAFGGIAPVSGGILGATSSTVPAYSVALTAGAAVFGGGAGATPTPQAFTLNGGGTLTGLQRATEIGYITLTQGGNLTLPAQTTPYTVTLATAVSCNTVWDRGLISITTAFSGGTGGLTATIQHNSADIIPAYNIVQTGGDVNFWDDTPPRACVGTSTASVTIIFTGDGSNNLSGYTAGAIKIRLEAHKDQ